jgi:hypothetical protein
MVGIVCTQKTTDNRQQTADGRRQREDGTKAWLASLATHTYTHTYTHTDTQSDIWRR